MLAHQSAHPVEQVGAYVGGVALQLFVLDDVEDGQARGAGYRAAAESVEVLPAVVEGRGHLAGGDDSAEWVAVADRLAEAEHVGSCILRLERPEVAAYAAEADLHFVGDSDGAGGPGGGEGRGEVARRRDRLPAGAHKRLGEQGGGGRSQRASASAASAA